MNPLVKAFIGSGVRWLVTILAARGYAVSEDETTQVISGAVTVAMLLWSFYQKHRTDKVIEQAKGGW